MRKNQSLIYFDTTGNNVAEMGKLQKCAMMEKQSLLNIFSLPQWRESTASGTMDK